MYAIREQVDEYDFIFRHLPSFDFIIQHLNMPELRFDSLLRMNKLCFDINENSLEKNSKSIMELTT